MYGRGKKLSKPKTQNIRNPFILNKKCKDRKIRYLDILWNRRKKERDQREKEHNERLFKDRIIWDIRALFEVEQEEDYH